MASTKRCFVVLGNHLFPWAEVRPHADAHFFMAEDYGLCTYARHHKQKIALFLAAMRGYRDELRAHGATVHYQSLDEQSGPQLQTKYETKLERYLDNTKSLAVDELVHFEVEDKFFEDRLRDFAERKGLKQTVLPSPMFVTPREEFAAYLDESKGKPFMARFYERQRKRLGVMVDQDGKPEGGQWSFDADNRKKLPRKVSIPKTSWADPTDHVQAVKTLVAERFDDHPGTLDDFWLPTTRPQALAWLRAFLKDRFAEFGPYEDALSTRDPVLFHSALSPVLNLGLITPQEIVDRAVQHAEENDVPLNSLEGLVRQVIGWREFIRGVYRSFSDKQESKNRWGTERKMKPCWWTGDTGVRPLDDAICKCVRFGWAHHIERLMVLANAMNLCEVEPKQAHDWFMAMFVDSADWVMGPNVYGMGLMSDGGVFATKPYICGSNYLLKMSDYPKPERRDDPADPDWAQVFDGLYWRFVDKHREFFSSNPRMSMMARSLDKLDAERKGRIFAIAEAFIERTTEPG
ncbi:MAG: cryptochrome/photolyase family protein [Planctomycetota bacterium]